MNEPAPTEESQAKSLARSRAKLLLLLVIFVSPIAVSWLFAIGVFNIDRATLTNSGSFVDPPLNLKAHQLFERIVGASTLEPGQWAIGYVTAGACGERCNQALAAIRSIKTVLGHDALRVTSYAVIGEDGGVPESFVRITTVDKELAQQLSQGVASGGATLGEGAIALFDWRGQMMMVFPHNADPGLMKKDLKRLLRGSRIR